MSRTDDIQNLITNYERRLQLLNETRALKGYDTEPQVRAEIEEIETTRAELRAELARLQTPTIDPRLLRDHYFISYAPTDGADFATALHRALAAAGTPTWFDQQHLDPAMAPERQINEALQSCAGLLLLVSKDSGDETAGCCREWALALRYKKPLILLRLVPEVDVPYRLAGYPLIGVAGPALRGEGEAFADTIAHLSEQLTDLKSFTGERKQVQAQLATAHADLRLAREEHRRRFILDDIERLKEELAVLERVAANPDAAVARTQQSIAAGIERERRPAERPTRLSRQKFINPPPLEVPSYFQDRFDETKRIRDFLKAPELRLLTVVGRGGIGKTALVARLLKHLERGELPDGIGQMAVDGIVYLSDVGARPLTFPNLFSDVSKLLPAEAGNALEAVYRDPQGSATAKMAALLNHFAPCCDDGSEGQPVIVLLDNFETRLDLTDHSPTDPELDEALHALITLPPHRLKVIITSRVAPRTLLLAQPHCQQPLYLDEGLVSPYAEAVLRARDPDGKLGLQNAADAELAPAVTHTRGYPRALEALAAALAADRDTNLSGLLAAAEIALPENVVAVLVGEAYSRLASTAQQVLQALAIYGRPVPLTSVDYLLEPHFPAVDSAPVLKRLVNMNFVSKEGGLYFLHPVDRAHALSLIPEGTDEQGKSPLDALMEQWSKASDASAPHSFVLQQGKEKLPYTQKALTRRAADYFKTTRKPRTEWKSLADLAPQLAEFDLRCEAGDFDAAALVLLEIGFDYLFLWGHYRPLIDLHKRLQGKIEDDGLKQHCVGLWGSAYAYIGETKKAITCQEKALVIARKRKDKWSEGVWLGNLGNRYVTLGETRRAIDYFEQALTIDRDIGNQRGEENQLGNLGICYASLGETRRAIEYYEQALVIDREIGDRRGESIDLRNLGYALLDLNRFEGALNYFRQAIAIADEIDFLYNQKGARCELAEVHLFTNDLPAARTAVDVAWQYDDPENNHNAAVLLGLIALRQGEICSAQVAFREAISLADELLVKTPQFFDALYAKGLAWAGLAVCASLSEETKGRGEAIDHALGAYRAALAINADTGIVVRQQRRFEALAVADSVGVLSPVAGVWK